jgi:putative hemolysin
LHELKHIPHAGERFVWNEFDVEVIDMDGQRIDKVLVKISEELKSEMEESA